MNEAGFICEKKPVANSWTKAILQARQIGKSYGSTEAVKDFDMDIFEGEVIGLLGGNGAGKSTLMRIISGVTRPDKGMLVFDGKNVSWDDFNPLNANRNGIRVVYQELSLCLNLKVYENFFIELSSSFAHSRDWRKKASKLAQISLDTIFPGNNIDVGARLDTLSICQQQMVEIARAFSDRKLRLLILDEPTSSLPAEETEQLMKYIRKKVKENISFIFITHRLSEAMKICDRIYVMQNGSNKWSGTIDETNEMELIRQMGGTCEIEENYSGEIEEGINSNIYIRASAVSYGDLHEINFNVQGGEMIGIAGLEGSGQRSLLHYIFQHRNIKSAKGKIQIKGSIAYVTGDRKKEGVFPLWSVIENMMITKLSFGKLFNYINSKKIIEGASYWYDKLNIKSDSIHADIVSLSGGNQQKVLIARALVADADIIILDDPTRGVDIVTKNQLYEIFHEARRAGKLIIWYSSDDEELSMCSRVFVMRYGGIVKELRDEQTTKDNIIAASFSCEKTEKRKKGVSFFHIENPMLNSIVSSGIVIPFIAMILVYVLSGITTPAVFSGYGLELLLGNSAPLVFATLAQMFIIGLGQIDLGIGAFVGLVNVICATIMFSNPIFGWGMIILALVAYSCMGLIIHYRNIPAIIVTLGYSFIWKGISLFLQDRPGGQSPEWLYNFFWNDLPIPAVLILIVVFPIVIWLFYHSKFGTVMKGFGNNPVSMVRSGWSQPFAYWATYLTSGVIAVIGGLVMTGLTGASDANASASYQMLTIAAVVVGGGYLVGGIVTVPGAVFGAITLSLISALLGFLKVSTEFTAAVQGLILIAILALKLLKRKERSSTV